MQWSNSQKTSKTRNNPKAGQPAFFSMKHVKETYSMRSALNSIFNIAISLLNLADKDGASPRIFALFQRRLNGLFDLFGITDETV